MNFSWNEEQKELKDAAIKFAKSKLEEGVIELDRNGEFSRKGWAACSEFGLQGILIPEAYGGMGLNALDFTAIMEGIGNGSRDNGLIFSVNAHILACEMPILHYGTDEQKQKYLPGLVNGKIIGANAMTEPDTGSNVYALQTKATKEKDYYILNGSKTFVTNAPVSDMFIVYAKTDTSKSFFGVSCFIVERNTKGFTVGNKIEKMGLRTSLMSDIAFNDCKVPRSNMIGGENQGGIIFSDSMEWERGLIMSNCIGVMERQLQECIRYINIRKVPVSRAAVLPASI